MAETEPYLCSICYEHPMIEPLTLGCCGNAVCRHCYVRHLEARPVRPRCPCCGSKVKKGRMPPVCVPLREAIARECAVQLAERKQLLHHEDQGEALARRIADVEKARFAAEADAAHLSHTEAVALQNWLDDSSDDEELPDDCRWPTEVFICAYVLFVVLVAGFASWKAFHADVDFPQSDEQLTPEARFAMERRLGPRHYGHRDL